MIFLQPQFRTSTGEILNVTSSKDETIGFLLYLFKEDGDLYILGHLDEIGEKQNFLDIVEKYVTGLKDSCGAKNDPYIRLHCGGEEVQFKEENKEQS